MNDLLAQKCKRLNKDDPKLSSSEINNLIDKVNDWHFNKTESSIVKEFKFKNYYETIAFVNATAWIIHEQDHHPEITINYNSCRIAFTTHSINSLSMNDFICAAKIDAIQS